jgi:hypothetical protein
MSAHRRTRYDLFALLWVCESVSGVAARRGNLALAPFRAELALSPAETQAPVCVQRLELKQAQSICGSTDGPSRVNFERGVPDQSPSVILRIGGRGVSPGYFEWVLLTSVRINVARA